MEREQLRKLRQKMKEAGISVYVIPSSDCHESEYVCAHYRAREYITGFTGSAGTAVVTLTDAGLWTDGRYFIQAERQLAGSGIRLFRMGEPGVPEPGAWVEARLDEDGCLGFDGRTMGAARAARLAEAAGRKSAKLITDRDLVGEIWEDRPGIPPAPVWILDECWSGESTESKLSRIREEMREAGADVHVLADLCDIAWILNLRGGDIPCVPVIMSFLCITQDDCVWYVRPEVVSGETDQYLASCKVRRKDYGEIYTDLAALKAADAAPGERRDAPAVLLDKRAVNYQLLSSVPEGICILDMPNPSERMKAVKNSTELRNLEEAHRKESIAFTRFMRWIKTRVGKEDITELSAAEYLDDRRKEQEHYLGQSFDPICAYGANAAMMHYSATEEQYDALRPEGFLLVDAGGHYLEGTTDTTRTFALGPLSMEQKRMFTAVCRGCLNLADAVFLYGCTGYSLDILCREPLWKLGTDYRCGTGHGVGYLLNVHEGPNAFRWKMRSGEPPAVLEPGMVTTDEPGVYAEGQYGIRTENELVCVEKGQNEYGRFLGFEPLTFVPIDLDAILPEEMNPQERKLLNRYHRRVYEKLSPYLDEEEREWLRVYTREI